MRLRFCFAAVMLLFFALQDLRTRSISLTAAGFFAAAALLLSAVCFFFNHEVEGTLALLSIVLFRIPETAAALIPGAVLLAVSFATRGGIGTGDAVIAFLLGLCLPVSFVAEILLSGLLFSAVYSAGQLMTGRRGLRSAFPFIPFLLPGLLTVILLHPL